MTIDDVKNVILSNLAVSADINLRDNQPSHWQAYSNAKNMVESVFERFFGQQKGCEYCKDTVIILRKISCDECPYGVTNDNEKCGKLPKCPQGEFKYYYENVCDNKNNYCPMCGKPCITKS